MQKKNNINLNVDERLRERKFGVNSMSELPKDFFVYQGLDWNYKIGDGESLNEVSFRMKEVLIEILNKHKDKKIIIVLHGTALTVMLKDWCNIKINYDTQLFNYYFTDELFFDGKWEAPELFRLEFDDTNNLINIENIKRK